MAWRRKEPGHQQPWFWQRWTGITRPLHIKGWDSFLQKWLSFCYGCNIFMGNVYSRNIIIPIIAPIHVFETGLVQIKGNKQDMEVSDRPVMNVSLFDEKKGRSGPWFMGYYLWINVVNVLFPHCMTQVNRYTPILLYNKNPCAWLLWHWSSRGQLALFNPRHF